MASFFNYPVWNLPDIWDPLPDGVFGGPGGGIGGGEQPPDPGVGPIGNRPPYEPGTGWTGPSTGGYRPGSAPGYGTEMDPENAGFNLFADARAWLSKQPQIWNPYGGQMVAGLSPWTHQGAMGAAGLLGFQPQNVTSAQVNPAQAAYAGDVMAQNVTGGSFLGGPGIGAYMNPYTSNVVDVALGDIERSRQMANAAGARSASASTYGGDRNALIEAETNRAYADQSARTAAQLRSQGFDTAAGLMGQDLGRGFQAGLANQGANLSAGLANQGMRQGLNQYNTAALNNMGQFNAGLGLQAQGMNQQAGLAGAQLGLGAANQLGLFGARDQATNQAGMDAAYNEYLRTNFGPLQGYNFLAGLLPGYGQYNPQGPSRTSGFLGGAATGAGIGGFFGPVGAGVGAGLGGLLGWLG